ncbi:MAG: tetratricopeptide repeat protein [Desulfuromonadales bacterium]|nr:tetratricopeptide repeat protein [Desulfuromonadales bacterium]
MATKDQLIASAQKNLEKGQINKAIKDYQELLKLEPKVDQHKQKLADLLCRANLKEDALVLYDSLAKGYAERGFFAKGIAVYKQMQRIDPTDGNIYLRLAELNCHLGLIGNAMSEYRSLLGYYENCNMAANAAEILQKMVALEPENINLQLRVLQNFLKEKKYVQATETILKACEACAKSGNSAKSQKILHSILAHLPDNKEFHTELASRLSAAGLFTDAIYLFQALYQGAPQDFLILNELATLYGKVSDGENERLYTEQLLAVQPTAPIVECLVRLCLASGDYSSAERTLQEHAALLGERKYAELARELAVHLPGQQPVSDAVAGHAGDAVATSAIVAAPSLDLVLPETTAALNSPETAEEFSIGEEEFGLDDLLAPRPRSSAAEPSSAPVEEEDVAEEPVEISLELPMGEVSFADLDTFSEDLDDGAMEVADDELAVQELDPFAIGAAEDEVESSVINIDFDFSQFDDVEIESDAEIEADFIDTRELDSAAIEVVDQVEPILTGDPDTNAGVPWLDLSPQEELLPIDRFQEETVQPVSSSDDDFSPESEDETEEEPYRVSSDDDIEELELEILDEIVDDEEILELEPLEEEELSAELAALEELLDAEMEIVSLEEQPVFTVAGDDAAAKNSADVDDDFFDLAAEILDEGALQATEDLTNVGEIDRFRFDSVFSEFKKGVDAQIDQEDTEAHYDLGIAYKEMGLRDDAIDEFKKSMRNPKRLADSLILIGICYAEKGAFAEAETVFNTAIARPEVQAADKVGTQYELALVYEVWGRPADALRTFEAVAVSDPCFRNVGDKIETLRLQVSAGAGKEGGDTPGAASPGKDRISFV